MPEVKYDNKATLTTSVLGVDTTFTSNTVTANLINLTILKTQSKTQVVSGDTIKYSFVCTNLAGLLLSSVTFSDNVPVGLTILPATFKVNGTTATPVIVGNLLTYVLPSLIAGAIANIEFDCTVN